MPSMLGRKRPSDGLAGKYSGDVYLLSDDPLNSDEVVFTIEVPSSNVVPDPEYPGYYIAVGKGPLTRPSWTRNGAVLALGNAPW